MTMTSSRPYIIRALYEWIVGNECTPYLLVDSNWPGVHLPDCLAGDDQVVLNVSPMAVRELELANDAVSCMMRFGGIAYQIYVPTAGVMAVYARENGQGMVFEMDPYPEQGGTEIDSQKTQEPVATLKSIEAEDKGDDDTPPPPKGGGRPSLKIVK